MTTSTRIPFGSTRLALISAVVLSLTMGGVAATSASATPDDVGTILSETNEARSANGLAPVTETAELDAVAQAWAENMAATQSMSHNPNYASQIPAGWTVASENVAYGYNSDVVVDAWMGSAGHRSNILSGATEVGIGYVVDGNGTAWSVQNFSN